MHQQQDKNFALKARLTVNNFNFTSKKVDFAATIQDKFGFTSTSHNWRNQLTYSHDKNKKKNRLKDQTKTQKFQAAYGPTPIHENKSTELKRINSTRKHSMNTEKVMHQFLRDIRQEKLRPATIRTSSQKKLPVLADMEYKKWKFNILKKTFQQNPIELKTRQIYWQGGQQKKFPIRYEINPEQLKKKNQLQKITHLKTKQFHLTSWQIQDEPQLNLLTF